MRRALTNQLGTGALSPAVEAWLRSQGALFARVGTDGVIEFSCRPFGEALADAARDLLPAAGSTAAYVSAHVIAMK